MTEEMNVTKASKNRSTDMDRDKFELELCCMINKECGTNRVITYFCVK